jgi:hypothetical protein
MDGNSAVCIVHFFALSPLAVVVSLVMHNWLLFVSIQFVLVSCMCTYRVRDIVHVSHAISWMLVVFTFYVCSCSLFMRLLINKLFCYIKLSS